MNAAVKETGIPYTAFSATCTWSADAVLNQAFFPGATRPDIVG